MAASSHIDYSSAAELRRSPAASSIVDLRNLLAGRFPQSPAPSRSCLKTGIATLDKATEGGLAKNCITELISPQINAGSAGVLHALLHTAHRDRYFLALIDGRDSFDPATAGNWRLRNLLWIRCHNVLQAVKAADLRFARWQFSRSLFWISFSIRRMNCEKFRKRAGIGCSGWSS